MVMQATRVVAVAAAVAVATGVCYAIWVARRNPLRAGFAAALWFCSSYGMFAIGLPHVVRWWRRRRSRQG
jgi:hypothetical protein